MIRRLAVAAVIALATPSLAEEMTMTEAAASASLHEGPLYVLASARRVAGPALVALGL